MNMVKYLEHAKKYDKCPNCGKEPNAGNVDKTATFFCDCGWKVEIDENGNEINKVKDDIPNEIFFDDGEGNIYQSYTCGVCGCTKFKHENIDIDTLDEVFELTDEYENGQENEDGLNIHCHCGDNNYFLTKVTEKSYDTVVEYYAWLDAEGTEYEECPECGNKEKIVLLLNKIEKPGKIELCCPKCHCLDQFDFK